MDNCWFVLKQSHYSPPKDGQGPIQLGHMVPDLKDLNFVINQKTGPLPLPRGMVVYESPLEDVKWEARKDNGVALYGQAEIPIAPALGIISAGGHAGFSSKSSVTTSWKLKTLNRMYIQPTTAYIEDSLEDPAVRSYIEKNQFLKTWKLFMITGLIVARGATFCKKEGNGGGSSIGPNV